METANSHPANQATSWQQTFLLSVLLFCGLSIISGGYHLFRYNQSIQLSLVYLLNDATLFQGDPFAGTLSSYSSFFWWLVAYLARLAPLEAVLFGLFVVEKLLLIYAAGRLASVFAPSSRLAVITTMALFALGLTPLVGSGTVTADYTEHTAFSIPFFLLAAASFHHRKMFTWALWTAVGFNFNSLYGAYALTYFGLVFLLDSDYRNAWLQWLAAFAGFLLMASPTIYLTLSAYKVAAADNEVWFQVARQRFPHHLFPLAWQPFAYLKLAVFTALVFAVSFWQRNSYPKLVRHLLIWTVVAFLWLLFAYAAAYLFKQPWMLVFHPGRATDIWYAFGATGVIVLISNALEQQHNKFNYALLLLALITMLVFWQPRLTPPLLVMLAVFGILSWAIQHKSDNNCTSIGIILLCALSISGLNVADRVQKQGNLAQAMYVHPAQEKMTLATWLREQTGAQDTVLFFPDWSHFRALSQRPAFVTIKDASAILWDRSYASEWVRRVEALGYDFGEGKQGLSVMKKRAAAAYARLDDDSVLQLQAQYGLRYWIVPTGKTSSFETVFSTANYRILELI